MKVSPSLPFQLIYTLFEHEYLGYLFESFVIQLNDEGTLTFAHQNISSKNAREFSSGLDDTDYELIKLMDSMQPDAVVKHFDKKKGKPNEFFLKIFDPNTGDQVLQDEMKSYVERRRAKILPLLKTKRLFEMGNDGEPAWKEIEVLQEKSTVLFHFRRNEDDTHYFPTIKYNGEKIEFQNKGAYILCIDPAYIVINKQLFSFEKEVDANKLKPFLNKKFISIPKKIEDNYYRKFVAPLVASFDVYAKGFDIITDNLEANPVLYFSELSGTEKSLDLFGNGGALMDDSSKILFELKFNYGHHFYNADHVNPVNVHVELENDQYTFRRVKRDLEREKKVMSFLKDTGLTLKSSRSTIPTGEAFHWIHSNKSLLETSGIQLTQNGTGKKKYFLGKSEMLVEIRENIDWFDIHAVIKFGEFEIPFKMIRNYILKNKREIELPNGQIAIIPEAWFEQYSELMAFADEGHENEQMQLQKHHISLVRDLNESNLAQVQISNKLERLRHFDKIEDYPLPEGFKGELRPYQKAGFNWMNFLRSYKLGGCLADDMGLGKTVQTLALLQSVHQEQDAGVSLLIMPTSLIYNWEKESENFTPGLKIGNYTGVKRDKDISRFADFDLIITSYGIIRQDIELLNKFHFNYIILDESQVIKNPESNISQCVLELNSSHRLVLTGTPIENSTLDLWTQMSFVNPGLLGGKSFFKKQFLVPIERKGDETKTRKLHMIIKPFLLRRHKSQVATDLPEKIENIRYCTMSPEQEEAYEKVKSAYRDKIMEEVEAGGLGKSHFMILQGLTKLRQIANHPLMADEDYKGDSGKLEDISFMLGNALTKNHKTLVFSQFVKHLKIVSEYLDKNNIKYAYLDGSTKDRENQVNIFQNDPETKVFLISLKAGGLGLNLTEAEYVFLLDPWWNPAIEAQAIDRAHRIGQKNKVFTYRFITKNTVEEKIMLLQRNKQKLASDLISTEESFVKNLSKEDLMGLLD